MDVRFRASIVAIGLLLDLPAAASGQAPLLSAQDYVEIRQLTSRYAQAVDSGADNGYALATLFVIDGVSIRPDAHGREELANSVRRGPHGPDHVATFTFNHVIEPAGSGRASGWQYVAAFRFDGSGPAPARGAGGGQASPVDQRSLVGRRGGAFVALGRYHDAYVKTGDGWRFSRREYVPISNGGSPAGRPAPRSPGVERWESRPLDRASASHLAPVDYLDIEQLVGSYGHALDSGFGTADNGPSYARLFTSDGVFYSRGRPMRGPEELAAIARAQPHSPNYARHFLTNPVIESSGGVVTGRQYLTVIDIGEDGAATTVYLGGYYLDVYRKTDSGWRFEERRSFGARSGP